MEFAVVWSWQIKGFQVDYALTRRYSARAIENSLSIRNAEGYGRRAKGFPHAATHCDSTIEEVLLRLNVGVIFIIGIGSVKG